MNRSQRWLILVFIVIVLSVGFFKIAVPNCLLYRAGCLGYPVTPSPPATAPGKFRILWTTLESWIAPTVAQSDPSILLVDTLLMVVCISITIPALYIWLKRWCDPDRALLGVMLFGVLYLMAFSWFFRGGGVPIEVALVCLGLALINRSWLWFIPLVILGALNRETSLILPAIYAAYHWREKWKEAAVLVSTWVVITAGLHIILGGAVHQTGGLAGTYLYNLSTLPNAFVSNLLFVPLAIGVMMSYRTAPPIFKRFIWVAMAYLAAIVVGGAWEEANRLLLPVIPLILPMLFSTHGYSIMRMPKDSMSGLDDGLQ